MPVLVAVADYNIAYLYYLRGEYTHSIELYRAARENCRTLGDAYREALCDLDQSEMYLELNLSEEGAHLAGRAQKAFLALGMGYEAAKAQTNLAISLTHHGDTAVAAELFRKARRLFDRENNRAWIATIDLYQALVAYQDHQSGSGPGTLPPRLRVPRQFPVLHQGRALPVTALPPPPGRGPAGQGAANSAWPRSTACARTRPRR